MGVDRLHKTLGTAVLVAAGVLLSAGPASASTTTTSGPYASFDTEAFVCSPAGATTQTCNSVLASANTRSGRTTVQLYVFTYKKVGTQFTLLKDESGEVVTPSTTLTYDLPTGRAAIRPTTLRLSCTTGTGAACARRTLTVTAKSTAVGAVEQVREDSTDPYGACTLRRQATGTSAGEMGTITVSSATASKTAPGEGSAYGGTERRTVTC